MFVFDTTSQRAARYEPTPKGEKLKRLQELVHGNIEILPHRRGYEAPWIAYANEEGMLQDLPSNFLAWGVLRHLGFLDSTGGLGFYFGNIVLMGKNKKALTSKQIEEVSAAQAKYLREMGEDDDADEKASETPKQAAEPLPDDVQPPVKKARIDTKK